MTVMGYELFEKLCRDNGVKPSHVAKETGIATATLTDWKKGRYFPKQDKIKKIAEYFCVDWEDFYAEEAVEPRYYIDNDTAEKAQELFQNKDMRILFDAARDSRPEDLQMAADLLRRLKETNRDG